MNTTKNPQPLTFRLDNAAGKCRVYRGEHYLGSTRKTRRDNSSVRGGAYRDAWRAVAQDGKDLGTFDTRREAIAAVAANNSWGL